LISDETELLTVRAQLGSTGDRVRRIQELLNAWAATERKRIGKQGAAALVCDGVFGALTLSAVKQFQQAKWLLADGVVGPFTYSMLASIPFAVQVRHDARPVKQSDVRLCWAASTEYWLRSQHQGLMNQEEIIEEVRVRAHVKGIDPDRAVLANGSLTFLGQPVWEERFRLTPRAVLASHYYAETAAIALRRSGRPIMVGTVVFNGQTNRMGVGHVRVLIGAQTYDFKLRDEVEADFAAALTFMDPMGTLDFNSKKMRHLKAPSPSGGDPYIVVWE